MTGEETTLHSEPGLDLEAPRRLHIVGVGGAGMSAIATLLVSLGHTVSGSDFKESRFTQRLRQIGVRVSIGHRGEHVAGVDAVAISSAVRPTNPEVAAALDAGIPVLRRADILRLLTTRWATVAVAGTHGKTTTSSMLAMVLAGAGLDPSYIVGGELNEPGANAHRGGGEYLVCEADESDGTFLVLGAAAAVVTSVDADHLERYGDLAGIEEAFRDFLGGVSGPRVVCLDDPGAARCGPRHARGGLRKDYPGPGTGPPPPPGGGPPGGRPAAWGGGPPSPPPPGPGPPTSPWGATGPATAWSWTTPTWAGSSWPRPAPTTS